MSEAEKQEGQKTIVAFVAGLLIGALLVWVFSSPSDTAPAVDEASDEATEVVEGEEGTEAVTAEEAAVEVVEVRELQTGAGAISVANQAAGMSVALGAVTFPNDEGWVAVRVYENDQLQNILGAARFSKEQGLVPSEVPLLAPTTAGKDYAVVFYTENGDREFDLASDVQVEGVWETFKAE